MTGLSRVGNALGMTSFLVLYQFQTGSQQSAVWSSIHRTNIQTPVMDDLRRSSWFLQPGICSDIPLHVRSFMDPTAPGTCIRGAAPDAPLPALWTLSSVEEGRRTVRCIGRDREEACALWSAQFPETTIVEAAPDSALPRCVRLLVEVAG